MAIQLTDDDLDAMDNFLDAVLTWCRDGRTDLARQTSVLAHWALAGAKGNETEFKKYMRIDPEQLFRNEMRKASPDV